jgi:hypothetical protein
MPRYYSFFKNKLYIYKPSHLQIYILMTIYITQLIYNIYILITILLLKKKKKKSIGLSAL